MAGRVLGLNLVKNNINIYQSASHMRNCSKWKQSDLRHIDEVIPKNVLEKLDNGSLQKEKGKVYDIKPFRLFLKKGVKYAWCLCGHSKSQPLCDGTHKIDELSIKLKPLLFKVEESKEYWLCNCKQTSHRPFCDGSHLPLYQDYLEKKQERDERLKRKLESK